MKKLYSVAAAIALTLAAAAQPCATNIATGSASNAFTNIENGTNPVAADKNLNTVVFVHRNNATSFGGHSGQLRYDISTNGGASWTNDQGILNPLSVNGTNAARYPQAAIYNPASNTNPANAYISYLAPTTATTFNGLVNGVRQLNGTGNTENYNQPASTQTLIPYSMSKGAPGVFWAIDWVYTGTAYTGFRIYKGQWNNSNDIVWSTNATITPSFNTAYSGVPQVADASIAFDPTGQFGWVCLLTHLTGGPTPYSFYPVFYRTTDGGNTWSSAMQVDLGTFPCVTSNIAVGNFASAGFDGDLVVDVNGEPHFITSICNGNNAYAVFFGQWHAMADITWHGGLFNVRLLNSVNGGRGTWGTAPNTVTMDQNPIASRTADGTKVFFSWTDNSTYTLGQANQTPNLFGRAFDAVNRTWTATRDFTSCNVALSGTIIHPKIAAEVLEPSSGTYKLAGVYNVMTSNDPILACNFRFMDNITWTNADFTTAEPTAPVSINEGATYMLCPSGSVSLTITGSFNQILWSDGSTGLSSNPITTPGTYTVMIRTNCALGSDTIVVSALNFSATATDSTLCAGDSTTLTVSGNSLAPYTWNPGNITANSIADAPSSTTTYSVTATGSAGCTATQTLTINVNALPVVAAAVSNAAICAGDSTTISASGASTYAWQPGNLTNAAEVVSPSANTTYVVTGTDANGCTNTDSVEVVVNPLPVVTATTNVSAVCAGDTVTLMSSGAATYVWTPSADIVNPNADTTAAIPSASTTFTVSGTDANGCMSTGTISVNVNALPVLSLTSSGSICEGNAATLYASGAASYVWMPVNVTADSISVSPLSTTTYYVSATDSNGCGDSDSITLVVYTAPVVTAAGPSAICAGSNVTITASGANTYVWTPNNTTTNPLVDAPTATTTYTVIGTSSDGCNDTTTHTVIVNPIPNVLFSIPATNVCIDDASLQLVTYVTPNTGTFSGPGVSNGVFSPSAAGNGTHTITYTYTDPNGCDAIVTDVITVNACVGVQENASINTNVYPNPFGTQFTVEMSKAAQYNVQVVSVLGQQVMNENVNGNKLVINSENWDAGVYFMTVTSGNTQEIIRVVKQ
jgi:Secretion system C-terminal sorting domain